MDISLDTSQVLLEHVHLGNGELLLHAELLTNFEDTIHILKLVEIWYITTIKDTVNIFELLFLDDLSINEQECGLLVLNTSL